MILKTRQGTGFLLLDLLFLSFDTYCSNKDTLVLIIVHSYLLITSIPLFSSYTVMTFNDTPCPGYFISIILQLHVVVLCTTYLPGFLQIFMSEGDFKACSSWERLNYYDDS